MFGRLTDVKRSVMLWGMGQARQRLIERQAAVAAARAAGEQLPPPPTRHDRVKALAQLRAQPLGSGPGPRPAALDALRRVAYERQMLLDDMAEVVELGRAVGCTWAEIGAAAGITRQAARERWHHLDG